MSIDFRNTNTVWASIIATTLQRLGLSAAVVCPGSRSTPLTFAFASHPEIEAIPILDERSAAFFALGIARQTGLPVAIACTSGTAGANFYPAIVEARESRVPLLILTADRPPELRDCPGGQAIDQVKLYGHYPNWQTELATPSLEITMLRYLRQTIVRAWELALFPVAGAVHLNCPFRDPLPPLPEAGFSSEQEANANNKRILVEQFFAGLESPPPLPTLPISPISPHKEPIGIIGQNASSAIQEWQQCERGIIIAGPAQPGEPELYCRAIANLSQTLGWPVLAEGLSPLRNYGYLNPYLISTYDSILRNSELAEDLTPTMAIQIGQLPTSKKLREWLDAKQPRRWAIDSCHHNLDPLHGQTTHLWLSIEQLVFTSYPTPHTLHPTPHKPFLESWCNAQEKVGEAINRTMADIEEIIEPKVAWLLSRVLPPETPLFIANSMPVRDVEYFWAIGDRRIRPFFNRGANGIDGTLSTALGIASPIRPALVRENRPGVLLTGDLALLHDTNGFLLKNKFKGHLTIVLINNNGGGIFEMLPVSQFDPPFEEFFAMPQNIDFRQLCATYGVEHRRIGSWSELTELLSSLPARGIRVLEVPSDRKADTRWRQEHLGKFAIF
ncbi:MAG: 2-succinyl-5-enolpyruvyl-6-hydroxy-3-cyclohexene-1-carboxylic-acid synthase [Oscillatoria sp. SIO1A7]|nr:2-succinyl-5-enolpyruvyl-6-hydroxy-3-cyclohexene-1-carboxylic-acid synthase [Oscillatoria sp. SIO1A7]